MDTGVVHLPGQRSEPDLAIGADVEAQHGHRARVDREHPGGEGRARWQHPGPALGRREHDEVVTDVHDLSDLQVRRRHEPEIGTQRRRHDRCRPSRRDREGACLLRIWPPVGLLGTGHPRGWGRGHVPVDGEHEASVAERRGRTGDQFDPRFVVHLAGEHDRAGIGVHGEDLHGVLGPVEHGDEQTCPAPLGLHEVREGRVVPVDLHPVAVDDIDDVQRHICVGCPGRRVAMHGGHDSRIGWVSDVPRVDASHIDAGDEQA